MGNLIYDYDNVTNLYDPKLRPWGESLITKLPGHSFIASDIIRASATTSRLLFCRPSLRYPKSEEGFAKGSSIASSLLLLFLPRCRSRIRRRRTTDQRELEKVRGIHRVMQSDRTEISLRPGGGNRGGRILGPRFDSAASAGGASDLPALRPHGGAGTALPFKVGANALNRSIAFFVWSKYVSLNGPIWCSRCIFFDFFGRLIGCFLRSAYVWSALLFLKHRELDGRVVVLVESNIA